MRYIAFSLMLTTVYACNSHTKKNSDNTQPAASNLTPADLSTPNFEPMTASDFKRALTSNYDLFEYETPEKTSLLATPITGEQCFNDFFKKYPVVASGNYLRFRFDSSQDFISCFILSLKEAIDQAAKDSNGSITITPSDPNKPYDPDAECAKSSGDSYSIFPKAGGSVQSEIFSDIDLSSYNGQSIADVSLKNKGQKYFLPFTNSGRQLNQSKSFSDGMICAKKVYGTFTAQNVQVEDCQIDKLKDNKTVWNCTSTYSVVVSNTTMDKASFETLRKGEHGDHYLKVISENIVKKEGDTYPLSGKKTVTYRNWQGTITFNGDKPTYQFSNGSETVSGTMMK